jgi:putative ABC transport system permease protein
METLWRDVKHSVRLLGAQPGFTITAIAALALGIGANTAIFSVVNTVLLKPLPYPGSDRLVQLMISSEGSPGNITSIPKYMVWREQNRVLEDISAYDFGGPGINLTGGDRPEQIKGIHVSASYFRLFGVRMVAGRTFSEEEDRPGGGHVAVISNGLWKRRFGADLNLVGKTILLGGEPHIVLGVTGSEFVADPPADIWLPLQADPNSTNQGHYLRAAARLKPGVTLEQARTQMKMAAEEFRRKFAGAVGVVMGPQDSFTAQMLQETMVSNVRPALLVLIGGLSSCSSSLVPTSPTCCWRGPRRARAKSPSARLLEPAAAVSSANCSPKVSCSPSPAALWDSGSGGLECALCWPSILAISRALAKRAPP